jgi:DNA-binding FadR family transcriptional regulator
MPNLDAVTSDLERRLATEGWNPGDQFDTFDELKTRYPILTNVYRIREAVAPLITAGLLESRQGSGTWVRRVPSPPAPAKRPAVAVLDELLNDIDALRAKVTAVRLQLQPEPQ